MGKLINPPPGYAERWPQDSGGASFSDPELMEQTAADFRRALARVRNAQALEQSTDEAAS